MAKQNAQTRAFVRALKTRRAQEAEVAADDRAYAKARGITVAELKAKQAAEAVERAAKKEADRLERIRAAQARKAGQILFSVETGKVGRY